MKFLARISLILLLALGLKAQEKGPYTPLGQQATVTQPSVYRPRFASPFEGDFDEFTSYQVPTSMSESRPGRFIGTAQQRIGQGAQRVKEFVTTSPRAGAFREQIRSDVGALRQRVEALRPARRSLPPFVTPGVTYPEVETQIEGEFGAEDIPTYQPVKMSLGERIKSWFTPTRSAQEIKQNLREKLSKSISENSAFRAVSDAITNLGKNVYGIKNVDFKAYARQAWDVTAGRAWSNIQERALMAYNYAQRKLSQLRGIDRATQYERAYRQINPQDREKEFVRSRQARIAAYEKIYGPTLSERIKQKTPSFFAPSQESDRARAYADAAAMKEEGPEERLVSSYQSRQRRAQELSGLPTTREIEYTRAYEGTETDPFVEKYYA